MLGTVSCDMTWAPENGRTQPLSGLRSLPCRAWCHPNLAFHILKKPIYPITFQKEGAPADGTEAEPLIAMCQR